MKTYTTTWIEAGKTHTLTATVRYDDECRNGHNTFSITGVLLVDCRWASGGCLHELIAEKLPELVSLIKWHLCSSDGPLGYVDDTMYLADDRDCWGLRKGEFQQFTDTKSGLPLWHVPAARHKASKKRPAAVQWERWGRIGEGKDRDLDSARRAAIWLDATDDELTAPGLEERLKARLPALMSEFRAVIESLGFQFDLQHV